MNNLLTAIATKISGSTLSSDVGGRIYLDQYPPDEMPATYPYIIYFIVSGIPDNVFVKDGESILIQFSLFSASSGVMEITTMHNDLKTLFDDCDMTIPPTGTVTDNLVWFKRAGLTTMTDEITTDQGTSIVKHWAQEYEITIEEA